MPTLEEQYFPLWKHGYRCNPFRALTQQEWHELALLAPNFLPLLAQHVQLVQVLGEKGYGKTSLMMALMRHLEEQEDEVRYVYIRPGRQSIPSKSTQVATLLVDEAQRISSRAIHDLLSSLQSKAHPLQRLILSSHVDLSESADKHNLEIASFNLPAYSFGFVKQIIQARLQHFRMPGEQAVNLSPSALKALFEHSNGNLRELEKMLYEIFQTWQQGEWVAPADIRGYLQNHT